MTREKAQELLPIIQAYAEGKTIQVLRFGEWEDLENLNFVENLNLVRFDEERYRIKPEEIASNKLRCFKCGKQLNADNMSNVIYTSNPPRYTCKDCEGIKAKENEEYELPEPFNEKHTYKERDKKPELTEVKPITAEDLKEDKDYQPSKDEIELEKEIEYEPFECCSDLIEFCGTKLIYVINKKYKTEMLITGFDDEGLPPRVLLFGDMWVTLEELFENYTFCDGHPCGKHIYTEEE